MTQPKQAILRADQMAVEIASGMTICEIARKYGVTVQAVQNACKRRGVRSKWPRGRPTEKLRTAMKKGQRP